MHKIISKALEFTHLVAPYLVVNAAEASNVRIIKYSCKRKPEYLI